MKTIYSKLFLSLLLTFLFSLISVAQYKIQGPGISPSKDTVYAGIKYEYKVANFPNTRSLVWQTLWGLLDGREGQSVKITWDNVPQGTIMVTGFNGTSNVIMEAKVKISGIKPDPKPEPEPEPEPDPKPERPSAPQFVKEVDGIYYFTNVSGATKYKWTLPDGCSSQYYGTGTFIHNKNVNKDGNVYINLYNTNAYVDGYIEVQAISDNGSLLSEATKVKYNKFNIWKLKMTEAPSIIEYGNTKNYTFAVEEIPNAKYSWQIEWEMGSIIEGENTNKVIVRPDYPFGVFLLYLSVNIDGKGGGRNFGAPVPNSGEILGPDIIYNTNDPIVYSANSTSPYFISEIICWHLDGVYKGMSCEYILNPNELSVGNHILESSFLGYDNVFAKKLITKYKDPLYSISYNRSINEIKISKLDGVKSNNNASIQIYDQKGIRLLSKNMSKTEKSKSIPLTFNKKGIFFVIVNDGINKTTKTIAVN